MDTSRIVRFSRTDDKAVLFMSQIRTRFKPPPHNPHLEGEYNPADMIIGWCLKLGKKKLRKWCDRHSLDSSGSRFSMMKRLYLHWRAAKFASMKKLVGSGKFVGYGKGYENVKLPACHCGSTLRNGFGEKRKVVKGQIYRKFYPRYKRGRTRFPRLDR